MVRVIKFYTLNLGSFLYVTQISKRFLKIYIFFYLSLVVLGLHCWIWAVSSCGEQGATLCCGAWAQLPRGMWRLPRHGVKPVSTTLAGRSSGPLQRFSI